MDVSNIGWTTWKTQILLLYRIVTKTNNNSDCGHRHSWLNHVKICVHHFLVLLSRLIYFTLLFTVLTSFYRQHFGTRRRASAEDFKKLITNNYQFITIRNGKENQVSRLTLRPTTTICWSHRRARRSTRPEQSSCWGGSEAPPWEGADDHRSLWWHKLGGVDTSHWAAGGRDRSYPDNSQLAELIPCPCYWARNSAISQSSETTSVGPWPSFRWK